MCDCFFTSTYVDGVDCDVIAGRMPGSSYTPPHPGINSFYYPPTTMSLGSTFSQGHATNQPTTTTSESVPATNEPLDLSTKSSVVTSSSSSAAAVTTATTAALDLSSSGVSATATTVRERSPSLRDDKSALVRYMETMGLMRATPTPPGLPAPPPPPRPAAVASLKTSPHPTHTGTLQENSTPAHARHRPGHGSTAVHGSASPLARGNSFFPGTNLVH